MPFNEHSNGEIERVSHYMYLHLLGFRVLTSMLTVTILFDFCLKQKTNISPKIFGLPSNQLANLVSLNSTIVR